MADLQQTQTDTPAPVSGGDAAPAASPAPVVTPVTPTAPESTPVIGSPDAAATPAKEDAAAVSPKSEPAENILGDTKTSEPVKEDAAKASDKTDAKPDADKKPDGETKPSDAPTPPVYEFKLPENVTLDKEPMDAFSKLIGEIETGKLDHTVLQEKGQALVDMHIKGVQNSIERYTDSLVNFHENQKKEWFENFKKDPELGGDNLVNTVSNLRTAIESYAGNEAQVAEFRQVMKDTGVGNHTAVIRLLNNMDAKIRKYETEADNGAGGTNRMTPATRPAPTKVKDYQLFYSKMG